MFLRDIAPSDPLHRNHASSAGGFPEPRPYDILCGKDKTFNKHHGNQVFRELIVQFQDTYVAAKSKHEKMRITKDIVSSLKAQYNARFVKLSKNQESWVEISDQVARDKVSHALRFAAKQHASSGVTTDSSVSKRSLTPSPIPPSQKIPQRLKRLLSPISAAAVHSSTTTTGAAGASFSSSWMTSSNVTHHSTFTDSTASSITSNDEDVMSVSEHEEEGLTMLTEKEMEEQAIEALVQRQRVILSQMNYHNVARPPAAYQPPAIPQQQPLNPEFDTLRSEDLDAILDEAGPFLSLRDEEHEWQAVMQMAR